MKTKSARIKILKRKTKLGKGIVYNLMEVVSATAEYDGKTSDNVTDSIAIKIPKGITQIHVEALESNEINIFYHEPEDPFMVMKREPTESEKKEADKSLDYLFG